MPTDSGRVRSRSYAVGAALRGALDVIGPRCCAHCGAAARAPGLFCAQCTHELERWQKSEELAPGVPLLAAFRYAGPITSAIVQLKYGARSDLARPLARLASPELRRSHWCSCDALVPVPLHRARLAERGFNQSALLGRELGRCGLRLLPRALVRTRHTARQVGQERQARWQNLSGAFLPRDPAQLRGQRVVLLDDVVTTGATALACVEALHTAGAQVCAVLAIARTYDTRG